MACTGAAAAAHDGPSWHRRRGKKGDYAITRICGTVEAINRVDVKARVTGYLEAVLFKEGDAVKEGAPLYRIEKGQFEAAVKQAQGALERAKAAKILTEIQLQRAEDLLAKNSGTVVARDQALAADQQAHAGHSGGRGQSANRPDQSRLHRHHIAYRRKNQPNQRHGGKCCGPRQGTLTTIVSQDPMYVTFPVSLREFLSVAQTSQLPSLESFKVKLRYSNGSVLRSGRDSELSRRDGRIARPIRSWRAPPSPTRKEALSMASC